MPQSRRAGCLRKAASLVGICRSFGDLGVNDQMISLAFSGVFLQGTGAASLPSHPGNQGGYRLEAPPLIASLGPPQQSLCDIRLKMPSVPLPTELSLAQSLLVQEETRWLDLSLFLDSWSCCQFIVVLVFIYLFIFFIMYLFLESSGKLNGASSQV